MNTQVQTTQPTKILNSPVPQVEFDHVTAINWPRNGPQLLTQMLSDYFGPAFSNQNTSDKKTKSIALSIHHDCRLNAPQVDGEKYLVQFLGYLPTVVKEFDQAVKKNGRPDTKEFFRTFASKRFTRYMDFKEKWVSSAFAHDENVLILTPEDLATAPEISLALAVRHLTKDHTPDEARIKKIVAQNKSSLGIDAEINQEFKEFRFFDTDLFSAINRIKLRREQVLDCFDEVLKHPPPEANILHLQHFESVNMLTTHLKNSVEYKNRVANERAKLMDSLVESKPQPAPNLNFVTRSLGTILGRNPKKSIRPELKEPALIHLHIPKTARTNLNGKLLEIHPEHARVTTKGKIPEVKLKDMTDEQRNNVRVIAGHCVYGIHELLPRPSIYVCLLREPGPRLYSFYRFVSNTPIHPYHDWVVANAPTFGTFLSNVKKIQPLYTEVDNGQVRRISGNMSTPIIDQTVFEKATTHLLARNMIFGLTESFGHFLTKLSEQNFISNNKELRANVPQESANFSDILTELSQSELTLLEKYTAWDLRLYTIGQAWLGHSQG